MRKRESLKNGRVVQCRKEVFDIYRIKEKISICGLTIILLLLLFVLAQRGEGEIANRDGLESMTEDFAADEKVQKDSEVGAEADEELGLRVLTESGFYDEDIWLEAELEREGKVFYTSDGSMPGREEGGSTHLYREPILLAVEDEE